MATLGSIEGIARVALGGKASKVELRRALQQILVLASSAAVRRSSLPGLLSADGLEEEVEEEEEEERACFTEVDDDGGTTTDYYNDEVEEASTLWEADARLPRRVALGTLSVNVAARDVSRSRKSVSPRRRSSLPSHGAPVGDRPRRAAADFLRTACEMPLPPSPATFDDYPQADGLWSGKKKNHYDFLSPTKPRSSQPRRTPSPTTPKQQPADEGTTTTTTAPLLETPRRRQMMMLSPGGGSATTPLSLLRSVFRATTGPVLDADDDFSLMAVIDVEVVPISPAKEKTHEPEEEKEKEEDDEEATASSNNYCSLEMTPQRATAAADDDAPFGGAFDDDAPSTIRNGFGVLRMSSTPLATPHDDDNIDGDGTSPPVHTLIDDAGAPQPTTFDEGGETPPPALLPLSTEDGTAPVPWSKNNFDEKETRPLLVTLPPPTLLQSATLLPVSDPDPESAEAKRHRDVAAFLDDDDDGGGGSTKQSRRRSLRLVTAPPPIVDESSSEDEKPRLRRRSMTSKGAGEKTSKGAGEKKQGRRSAKRLSREELERAISEDDETEAIIEATKKASRRRRTLGLGTLVKSPPDHDEENDAPSSPEVWENAAAPKTPDSLGEATRGDPTPGAAAIAAAMEGLSFADGATVDAWLGAVSRAEATQRRYTRPTGGRVRFADDFSAWSPPSEAIDGSERECSVLVAALRDVRASLHALVTCDPAGTASLRDALAAIADNPADNEPSLRGAAALYANEAAAALEGGESALSRRLDELASSLVRFHLRSLLNAPPPPISTERSLAKARRQRANKAKRRASTVHAVVKLASQSTLDAFEYEASTTREASLASLLADALDHCRCGEDLAPEVKAPVAVESAESHVELLLERVDWLRAQLERSSARRFATALLHDAHVDAAVRKCGGWTKLETAAASLPANSRYAQLAELEGLRRRLAADAPDDAGRRDKALAELQAWHAARNKSFEDLFGAAKTRRRDKGKRALVDQVAAAAEDALRADELFPVILVTK